MDVYTRHKWYRRFRKGFSLIFNYKVGLGIIGGTVFMTNAAMYAIAISDEFVELLDYFVYIPFTSEYSDVQRRVNKFKELYLKKKKVEIEE